VSADMQHVPLSGINIASINKYSGQPFETPYNRRISEKVVLEIREGVVRHGVNEIAIPRTQQDCYKSFTK
jgi:hypothetical protein